MADYKKLLIKQFPPVQAGPESEGNSYWEKFKSPVTLKEFASVNSIHFSPVSSSSAPHFVVSASARIQIYETLTYSVKKTISRFSDTAYVARYRSDGKLIGAGDGSGIVQLFDTGSRAILRTFKGHDGAIKAIDFSSQKTQIVSGSDDCTVRVWDITSESAIHNFAGHGDYVRSTQVSPASPFLIASGSYDHTVKLWDTRVDAGQGSTATLTMNHGDPIESIVFLPGAGSNLIASVGGNKLKIWDIMSGGKLVHSSSQHQKTITCLSLDGSGGYLLTGSLDQHVKMVSLKDYKVVHSIKYAAPILSLGVDPNNTHLAVGMSGGIISVRKRPVKAIDSKRISSSTPRGGTHSYFLRGSKAAPVPSDTRVESQRHKRLRPYDSLLKKYQYSAALDTVLSGSVNPLVVVSLMEELIYRDVLHVALAGRDESSLDPVVHFISKNVRNPRYSDVLLNVAGVVFDIYEQVLVNSPIMYEQLSRLKANVRAELSLQRRITPIVGILDSLFAGASAPVR